MTELESKQHEIIEKLLLLCNTQEELICRIDEKYNINIADIVTTSEYEVLVDVESINNMIDVINEKLEEKNEISDNLS